MTQDNAATQERAIEAYSDITHLPAMCLEYEENRASKLAYLKATAELTSRSSATLILKLVFDEYTSGLAGGSVRYSLKRADLNLEMFNCAMPYEQRNIRYFLPLRTSVHQETVTENSGFKGASKLSSVSANTSIKESRAAFSLKHERSTR